MNCWILIITVLFSAVNGEKTDSFVFSKDRETLYKCIENFILNTRFNFEDVEVIKVTADLAAKRFSGKTKTKKAFQEGISNFFHHLRHNKLSHPFKNNSVFSTELVIKLKKALINCADEIRGETNVFSSVNAPLEINGEAKVDNNEKMCVKGRHEELLSECIEDYLVNTDSYYAEAGVAKVTADLIAKKFLRKKREDITKVVNRFFSELQRKKSFPFKSNQTLFAQLRVVVKKALEYCIDDIMAEADVPIFEDEANFEIAEVLNYILVIWPFKLDNMIRTQSGRTTLRRYADNALAALEKALKIYDNFDDFRLTLRIFWFDRARRFYDNDSESRYIPYRFTLNNPRPHVKGDLGPFLIRTAMSFNIRNPSLPKWNLYKILGIHQADRPGHGEFDIFAIYEKQGLTSAEYYFENQIIQFYRILFFFLELRIWGISGDELPYDSIPEEILAILYDDDAYSAYLIRERIYNELVESDTQNNIRQNLARTARVYEEILLVWRMNVQSTSGWQIRSTSPRSTIFTTSETSTNTLSTTPQSRKRSKKGSIFFNQFGKHFDKLPKTAFPDDSCSNEYKTSNTKNSKMFVCMRLLKCNIYHTKNVTREKSFFYSRFHTPQLKVANYNYYGYITQSNISEQKLFPAQQALFLTSLDYK